MSPPDRPLRVGFIGTGRKLERPGPMGYAMAYQHAAGYKALPPGTVELAACADISRENGEAFRQAIGFSQWMARTPARAQSSTIGACRCGQTHTLTTSSRSWASISVWLG